MEISTLHITDGVAVGSDCIRGSPFLSCPEQGRFVEQLYGSGMVDEAEKEALHAPIERLERRLMRRGALGWRSPRVDEVGWTELLLRVRFAHSMACTTDISWVLSVMRCVETQLLLQVKLAQHEIAYLLSASLCSVA